MHAQLRRIAPDHAKLHGISHGRAVRQQLDTAAHFRKFLRQDRRQSQAQPLPLVQVFRQHDHLGDIALRKYLVERQIETRHAGTDPGRDRRNTVFGQQPLLDAFGDALTRSKRGAFCRPELHQDLRAAGVGKELLLHTPHADDAKRKEQHRGADGEPAVLDTPVHRAPEGVVETRVEQLVRRRIGIVRLHLEQQRAQVRHKINRDDPAQAQRDDGDREDRVGIFAGHRLGQADGQETGCRNQRARQHRLGRDLVGKGGGAHLVVALLHLAHHHLDRDDRVVHQQAQRDDQ